MKDIIVKLLLKNSDYNKGLKESENKTKGFSSSATSSLTKLAAGFATVTLAVNEIKKGLTDLAKETRGVAKVQAVIKATGGAAGIAASDIEKWTDQIQKTTEFSQDTSREVAALGLTFKNISKNVFPEVLSLSADMAAIVGTDMKGAMMQLAKAIDDPARQMTALRRSGVSFTEQQQKQIKVMQQSGDMLGAQNILLKVLREQIGGAAQAIGSTWIGTITRAKNAFDDLRKEFLKGFFAGGDLGFLEAFINNQDKIKAVVRQFAYDLTHNTILPEFKALFAEILDLLKFSAKGWGLLWETAIKPVLSQALKGWKLIAAVATTGLKNVKLIFENIGDIATDVFQIATMQIEIMIAKATSKIKPLLSFVQTYLQTGSFEQAQRSASAESKLGEARVFRSTMDLANYNLQSGDISQILEQNMTDLRNRVTEIMTESLTNELPQKVEEVKQTAINNIVTTTAATNETIQETKQKQNEILDQEVEITRWLARQEIDKIEEEKKLAKERHQMMLSLTTQSIESVRSIVGIVGNESLNAFGKLTGSVSAFSGLINTFAPGVGSLIGAGAGLLGDLFGQADNTGGADAAAATSDISTTSVNRPSATITKSGPDTVNYYINNENNVGAIVGEFGMQEFAQIITNEQRTLSASAI